MDRIARISADSHLISTGFDLDQSHMPRAALASPQPESLEKSVSYLDPVDTRTMKRIGVNVVVLVGVSFALMLIVAAVL